MSASSHRIALAFAALILAAPVPALATHVLLISEYLEGTSTNKALELFNPTGLGINLASEAYQNLIYPNGSLTPSSPIDLTGVIQAGDTFVITNALATAQLLSLADQTSGSLSFNGDDAVLLASAGAAVDVIGQIGFDPGTAWGSGSTTTLDHDLRRRAEICEGDQSGMDAFDPVGEWTAFGVDDFSNLSSHSSNCSLLGVPGGGSMVRSGTLRARPNPARVDVEFAFDLSAPGPLRLVVVDLAGRQVRKLMTGTLAAGSHRVVWDGRDDAGRRAPDGVCFARLRQGANEQRVRVAIVR